MAKFKFKASPTSVILRVKLMDSTSTTGAGLTGLTSASSGLKIATIKIGEATATVYTQAASTIETIATLGTYAAPTATKCRFKEVDATNMPGIYEVQFADARFASASQLLISINGAANLAQFDAEIDMDESDVNVTRINGGLTTGNNATLSLKQLNVQNSAGHAVVIAATGASNDGINISSALSNGVYASSAGSSTAALKLEKLTSSGRALWAIGYDTGAGILAQGGANGQGLDLFGGASAGYGLRVTGQAVDGALFVGGGNGNGLYLAGSGTGSGLYAYGGSSGGHGIRGTGQTSGSGLRADGGATNASGIASFGAGNASGIAAYGAGNQAGILAGGGATGAGLECRGGSSSGSGAWIYSQVNTAGMQIDGQGNANGLLITATNANGLKVTSTLSQAVNFQGTGGMILTATSGVGLEVVGAGPSGHGVKITAAGNGDGMQLTGSGTAAAINMLHSSGQTILKFSNGASAILAQGYNSGINVSGWNALVCAGTSGAGIAASGTTYGASFTGGAGNPGKAGIYCIGGAGTSGGVGGSGIECVGGTSSAVRGGHGLSLTAGIGSATGSNGFYAAGALTGAGVHAAGGPTGSGFEGIGTAQGSGMLLTGGNGGSLDGHGSALTLESGTSGYAHAVFARSNGTNSSGMQVIGNGNGAGLNITAGITGNGVEIRGGSTSGNGLDVRAQLLGHGVAVVGIGTSMNAIDATSAAGYSINAPQDINGNVLGTVASVVGDVGGNVVGTVASVVGDVGGNVVGTVASVVGDVGGNVVGTVASVVGDVGGDVQGNVDGSVASVTGNVGGNVAGDVQGNVDGSVASVTGNVGGNVAGDVAGDVLGLVESLGTTAVGQVNAQADLALTDYDGGGGVAKENTVLSLNMQNRMAIVSPDWMQIPTAGSNVYKIPLRFYDTNGSLEDPDLNEYALKVENAAGTSKNDFYDDFALTTPATASGTFAGFIKAVRNGTGDYYTYLKLPAGETPDQWLFTAALNESSVTIEQSRSAQVSEEAAATIDANIVSISGDAAAADALEAILDGTGATMTLNKLRVAAADANGGIEVTNTTGSAIVAKATAGNGHGVSFEGYGSGNGLNTVAGDTGHGARFQGGATSGDGFRVEAQSGDGNGMQTFGALNGNGIRSNGGNTGHGMILFGGLAGGSGLYATAQATTNGWGIRAIGFGTAAIEAINVGNGDGIKSTAGLNGHGMNLLGGSVTGDGLNASAQTLGDGIEAAGAGGGYDINADIQGGLSGAVASVVGDVGGNVVGTVADVVATVDANMVQLEGSATVDGMTLTYIQRLAAAMVNGKFDLNTPVAGQVTYYDRDNSTPLTVVDAAPTGRTRVS